MDIATKVTKLKMYPYFDIAHYMLMCMSVRDDLPATSSGGILPRQNHHLSRWLTDNVFLRQYISINRAQCTAISLNCIPIDQRGRKYLGFHIMFIFYWCLRYFRRNSPILQVFAHHIPDKLAVSFNSSSSLLSSYKWFLTIGSKYSFVKAYNVEI